MGRYRRVDTRIWNDEKFAALSDRGKLAFLFLLTHPHMTSLGAMRATLPGLAAELGWDTHTFSDAFAELVEGGMVRYYHQASLVWLPNFLRYNLPENPNVVKSWGKVLDLIPECAGKRELLATVRATIETLGQAFAKALPEPFLKGPRNPSRHKSKPFRIPDPFPDPFPYPEPIPKKKPETETGALGDFERFWSLYPRKRSREAARKAWLTLRPTAWQAAVLMAAVTAASATDDWERENHRYVPHAATWLRARRWEDEISPAAKGDGAADDNPWEEGRRIWKCSNPDCPDDRVHESPNKVSIPPGRRCPHLVAEAANA